MNVAAYCRVSTDKTDQLNSLDAQKRFFAAYTGRTGDTLVRLYADEGISGTKIRNRRAFQQLMHDAHSGRFQAVLVKDISRFARNTVDFLQSIRTLKALGIETQFLTANMTTMGSSEFVLTLFGALAQEESANTSKRIKFGKRLNAERGRVPNLVYGYDKPDGDCLHLTINAAEAETVRRIFHWYVCDGVGTTVIAGRLNDAGTRTKRAGSWTSAGVCRILKNPLYTGIVTNGRQEVADFLTGRRKTNDASSWLTVSRPELRLVAQALFDDAQTLLHTRCAAYKTENTRHSGRHPLSALIRCPLCGRAFRRSTRTYKNTYTCWRCSTRSASGAASCANSAVIDENALLDALQSWVLARLNERPGALDAIRTAILAALLPVHPETDQKKQLESSLSACRRKKQKFLGLYAQDLLTEAELSAQLAPLRREEDALCAALSSCAAGPDPATQIQAELHRLFPTLRQAADVRRLNSGRMHCIVRRIEVRPDGLVDVFLAGQKDDFQP